MKKVILFFSMALALLFSSCEKAVESKETVAEFDEIVTNTQKVQVPPGSKFIDVVSPDGETITIPVPEEFTYMQQNADNTKSTLRALNNSCCTTSPATTCSSVLTFYPIPKNTSTCAVNSFNIYVGQHSVPYKGMNKQMSTASILPAGTPIQSGMPVTLSVLDGGSTCINMQIVMGHWDCDSGEITFIDICKAGSTIANLNLGTVTRCFGKCGFNFIVPTKTCTTCSTVTATCS